MPRNSSGTYSLPVGAFSPGGLIKSADHNSNYSDIATALTQSLATTGVSTMTGQVKAAAGAVNAPGYAFGTDLTTGFWLNGAGQIGWAAAGVQGATFNSDKSVTWAGNASWAGGVTYNGAVTINGALTLNAASYTFSNADVFMAALHPLTDIGFVIDGQGSVITSGFIAYLRVPFSFTISQWEMIADQSGSITVDIVRAHAAVPTVSITTGGTAPSLSAAQIQTNGSVAGWTSTALVKDDYIGFKVTGSPSSVTRVTVILSGARTTAVS